MKLFISIVIGLFLKNTKNSIKFLENMEMDFKTKIIFDWLWLKSNYEKNFSY